MSDSYSKDEIMEWPVEIGRLRAKIEQLEAALYGQEAVPPLYEKIRQQQAKIERLEADRDQWCEMAHQYRDQIIELRAENERLRAELLDSLNLSVEWMHQHDELLDFVQNRPETLKKWIALAGKEGK